MKKLIAAALLAFTMITAFADQAVLERVSGQVSITSGNQAVAANTGAVFREGATISTGSDSSALLRFEDGQAVALHANSTFKIDSYRFKAQAAGEDKSVFSLLKGAARVVSGVLGQRNPGAFQMRTATATVGIRGTDFVVAFENPTAVSVISGNVSLASGVGSPLTLGAGQLGVVVAAGAAPALGTLTALPVGMQGAISSLSSLSISAGAVGGSIAGANAGAAAAGGITVGTAGIVAAGVAAVAVVAAGGENNSSTTTTTTTSAP